jgi:hypothetical protein
LIETLVIDGQACDARLKVPDTRPILKEKAFDWSEGSLLLSTDELSAELLSGEKQPSGRNIE